MLLQIQNNLTYFYFGGTTFIFILVLFVVIYILLHQKKVNKFHSQLQAERLKKQQAVFAAVHEGEEKERIRIAQELHDGINAKLSAIKSKTIHVAENTLDNSLKIFLQENDLELAELMSEIRAISHHLQPAFDKGRDLKTAIEIYIESINIGSNCFYSLFVTNDLTVLNEILQLHCYRIITELLQNIRKHANATEASVQLLIEEDSNLQIMVIDNGTGIDSSKRTIGIGLINLKNRVEQCEGSIHIDSSTMGTTIIINLPINALV